MRSHHTSAALARVAALVVAMVSATVGLGAPGVAMAVGPAGTLDETFGIGGQVRTDFGSSDDLRAAMIQPDGKIVAVGNIGLECPSSPNDLALARYTPNGAIDPTFGDGGMIIADYAGWCSEAYAAALRPDGKIVVAGAVWDEPFHNFYFALARYVPEGQLDPTFGASGWVTTMRTELQSGRPVALALVADAAIVVLGRRILTRYTESGALDSSFGTNGAIALPLGVLATSLAIRPDGKILVGGRDSNGGWRLLQYTAVGALDTAFGTDGAAGVAFGDGCCGSMVLAVALEPDGDIVATGRATANTTLAVARFTPSGALDTAFGTGGLTFAKKGFGSRGNSIVVQPDGRLVAAGQLSVNAGDYYLVRLNPDGSYDGAFGVGGEVITGFGSSRDEAFVLLLQPDGRIIAAGTSSEGVDQLTLLDFALARYEGGSTADTTPPVLTDVPVPMNIEATGPSGTTLSYPLPTATDPDDAASTPVCTPVSGSTFPLGSTTVTCMSSDTHGNTGGASFTVTVVDTTPPVFEWVSWESPKDATSPSGVTVLMEGNAVDLVDGPVPVTFAPPSGSTFPIGTSTVVASAVDSRGNLVTSTLTILVRGAPEQLNNLRAWVQSANLVKGASNALLAPLNAALRDIAHGDTSSACGDLTHFIGYVQAQSGKKIPADLAAWFLSDAFRIRAVLGC